MFKQAGRVNQVRVSQALAMPAPTAGLNDFDPLSSMDSGFMIDCMNVFPDTDMIKCRPGYITTHEGLGTIKSFMGYVGEDGSVQNFAVTDDGIYSIDGAAVKVYAGITNGIMGSVNFTTTDKNFLVAWNGTDPAVLYDGEEWVAFTETSTPTDPGQIDGLDPSEIYHAAVHMGRLWFVQKNSMTAYYLPVAQIGGEATPFFLGAQFNRGGHVMAAMRWSGDTGRGMDDRLVFITSEGEIASYSGTDPAAYETWSLDSVFYLAPPLGQRAISQYGGDILILSRKGLVPVSVLANGTTSEVMYAGTLSKYVNRTVQAMTAAWKSLPYPVEVFVHVELMWITINIWDSANGRPVQLVMNSLTGAWGKFSFPVRTIMTINNVTYMGTEDGRVLVVTPKSFVDVDNVEGEDPRAIDFYAMGAYTYLENPTALKHAKLLRSVWKSIVRPSFNMRALSDFRVEPYNPPLIVGGILTAPTWDDALWDDALWIDSNENHLVWVSANRLGYALAWQAKASTKVALGLAGIEWVWEAGGLV